MVRFMWISFVFLITCGTGSTGQPSTWHPGCKPDCDNVHCGQDNGCGGTCHCKEGFLCKNGKCENQYGCITHNEPRCQDCECMECVCQEYPECCTTRWSELCVFACKYDCGGCKKCEHQDCTNRECGPDPRCNRSCGTCPGDKICGQDGHCHECVPDCLNKVCGPDGCGGSCGTCPEGVRCDEYGQGVYPAVRRQPVRS